MNNKPVKIKYTVEFYDIKKLVEEINLLIDAGCELSSKLYTKEITKVEKSLNKYGGDSTEGKYFVKEDVSEMTYADWDEFKERSITGILGQRFIYCQDILIDEGRCYVEFYLNKRIKTLKEYKYDELTFEDKFYGDTPISEHGFSIKWHENGLIMSLGKNKNGIKDGVWRKWNENGIKIFEGYYENTRPHGYLISWFDNGNVNSISLYVYGKPYGRTKYWNEDGSVDK